MNIDNISINDEKYKTHKKVYEYALAMVQKEVHQAVEGMYHNLNTLQSRSGNQLPFTSINYGTCTLPEGRMITKALLEVSKTGLGKYGKTSIFPCGIFQCQKHVNREQGDPNYDLFRLALSSTAQRIYPNYVNVDWSTNLNGNKFDREQKNIALNNLNTNEYNKLRNWIKNNESEAENMSLYVNNNVICLRDYTVQTIYEITSTMGCRTYNGYDINCDSTYFTELFKYIAANNCFRKNAFYSANQKDGRGNLAPVTIILPTLAMEAGRNVEKFMRILDKMLGDARDMLMERFKLMCSQSPAAAKFMWENGTMLGYNKDEGIISALKHGTLAIGQIGLNETLMLLIGKNQTTEEGMELAKKIEGLINARCAEYKKEYHLNFGVYYTPAENLCKTAFKKFKNKYGDIEGVTYIDAYRKDADGNFIQNKEDGGFIKYQKHKEYFTNSIHVPVYDLLNAFEKIDIESQLTNYSNAGCITYVELPASAQHNIDAIEKIVNYAMDKDVPYFAMNFPIDNCIDCGYHGEIAGNICPKCGGNRIQRLRRVTGYITGDYKSAFNSGKIDETEDRNKHFGMEI